MSKFAAVMLLLAVGSAFVVLAIHAGSPEAVWFYCKILRLCVSP